MRVGEILVEIGACGVDRVREALEGQVIFGGRLGTNLLEIGAVTEDALAQALSRQHGSPALYGDIHVDERLAALLKPEHADRFEAVPYQLEGRKLAVLCCNPADLSKLDDLAFLLGKRIAPLIVPEARLFALLREHYGVERSTRGLFPDWARARRTISVQPERPPVPDLMGPTEFEALYAGSATPRTPAPVARRLARPWGDPGDSFGGALISSDEVLASLQAEAHAEREGTAIGAAIGGVFAMTPAPLSFPEAAAALSGVRDRGAIARVVLRYAHSRFPRAVLLTVHTRAADGWDGIGEGLTPQRVARVHVPLRRPGVVQTVVESRCHFLGPLARTEGNIRLLRALAGGAPKNAFAMPILARGRVVNVLYADGGRGGLVSSDGVGELLILAVRISQTYDVLLRRAT
jgi:hypothetical protein